MDQEDFEDLVADAIQGLPDFFLQMLDNVVIVVEDWPDRATLNAVGARSRSNILGLYHGVPQTGRSTHYGMVPPDKISIYRRPIEQRCHTAGQIRALVSRVVQHEIAHHFGISDDRLREIGAY